MKNLIDITIFLLLQYLFTTVILIILYQGGSYFHPDTTYFVMYQNYLSDLGRSFYFNGEENLFWSLYSGTLILLSLGTALFFYILSQIISKKSYLPLLFGIIASLGFIGVSFYLEDENFSLHTFFARLAYVSYLLGTLTTMIYWKKRLCPDVYLWLMILNFFLFGYLIIVFLAPPSIENEFFLIIRTVSQKIIVVIQILITSFVLFKIRKHIKP